MNHGANHQNQNQQNQNRPRNNGNQNGNHQQRNPRGAQNNGAQAGNVQQQGQAQQPKKPAHPQNHLKTLNGKPSAYECRKFVSPAQRAVLARSLHCLTVGKDTDGPRFRCGDDWGYQSVGHAAGAELRYIHDVLSRELLGNRQYVEVGASLLRASGLYFNIYDPIVGKSTVRNALFNCHAIAAEVDTRDKYFRRPDHETWLESKIAAHNEMEVKVHPDPAHQHLLSNGLKTETCDHAVEENYPFNKFNTCECYNFKRDRFDVEADHFPSVRKGNASIMSHALVQANMRGILSISSRADYFGAVVAKLKKKEGETWDSFCLAIQKNDPTLFKCVLTCERNHSDHPRWPDMPESIHTITVPKEDRKLFVSADVLENPYPYEHNIPLSAVGKDNYAFEYKYKSHPDAPKKVEEDILIFTEKVKVDHNGEVPYVTLRKRAILAREFANHVPVPVISIEDATWEDILTEMIDEVMYIRESLKALAALNNIDQVDLGDVVTRICEEDDAYGPQIEDVELFNVHRYKEKLVQNNRTYRIDPEGLKAKVESTSKFIRDVVTNLSADRKNVASFHIKYEKGKVYAVLRKRSSMLWVFVTEKAGDTAEALLDDVMKAYLDIGAKENHKSIHNSLVQSQRLASKDSQISSDLLVSMEAVIIARFLRAAEIKRFGNFNPQ